MKRSEINLLVRDAAACFQAHGWTLPPKPRWDVTDFGLGVWRRFGLVCVNMAEEPEYCEKLMYGKRGMVTPAHYHAVKKEDIICRWGELAIKVWPGKPAETAAQRTKVKVNCEMREVVAGEAFVLKAGERITITQGLYHEFEPVSDECVMGEVSTINDDLHDNFWVNPEIGRFPETIEDEEPIVRLLSDQ